jgi:hypothetical protein
MAAAPTAPARGLVTAAIALPVAHRSREGAIADETHPKKDGVRQLAGKQAGNRVHAWLAASRGPLENIKYAKFINSDQPELAADASAWRR